MGGTSAFVDVDKDRILLFHFFQKFSKKLKKIRIFEKKKRKKFWKKTFISIPEVGKDLFVSCEGTRMEAKITKDYINKNTQWLGNGDYITMGVMDMSSDWTDCRGTRDAVMGIR